MTTAPTRPAADPGHAGRAPRPRVRELVIRHPVTTAFLTLLVLTGAVTRSLVAGPPAPLLAAVGAGVQRHPSGLLTSALWCAGAWPYAATAVLAVLLLAPAERLLGAVRTVAALVVGQVAGSALGLAAIAGLAATGEGWPGELSAATTVGPLPGILAVAGLTTARSTALWRRRLRLVLSVSLIALVLYSGTTADVLRLAGWLLGLMMAAVWGWRHDALPVPHPSRREGRALVALVVAVTALGPLLAALSRTPDGPWAVVSHLFVSGRPGHGLLRAVCGPGGDPSDCRVLQARARLTGHGPALLTVLPVVLQVVLAEGLRRGRRAAWVAAVLLGGVLTLAGGFVVASVLRTPAEALPLLAIRRTDLPAVSVAAPLMAPLAVLLLLLVTHGRFDVRAAPGAGRRWIVSAAGGLAVVGLVYLGVGMGPDQQFAGRPSAGLLLTDLLARMAPPGWLGEFLPPLIPLHNPARALAGWAGVAAWTVLLVTAVRLVRPAAPPGDAVRARRLVDRHGCTPLAFMTTWVGNRYWFSPDGRAVVAYRVIGGVALTTGDPIGEPEARPAAVRQFTAWCEENGWTPGWYSVTSEVPDVLADAGFQQLQVAAETWLPLGDLAFTGRRWQDVRTAVNRAGREGVTALWTTWREAPLGLREQIVQLSEEWLAAKGLPEMGFTLGGLDELTDDGVRCLLAVDHNGRLHGLTSWLPAHQDGVTVGWTLDVMRRSRHASPGTVEFLIATAALTFQDEGAQWVSLSGAPLALPPGAEGQSALTRMLQFAGRTMEPVYGFRSLLAFKAKFQPHYRPLWLVYPSTADLPRIARAVSQAYLPDLSPAQAARLATALVRGHRHVRRPPVEVMVRRA